ncbi:EAL domain-containing response regulator [Rugamonas sp.]|uniref:EAL domain-containing response regulator n=1 Tax=Rugamonas sp. TaxID=1926287 RepID=UPI0025DDB4DF|nr:EAL domain-containing response regulator [Rugamonas sp.]
MAAPTQLRILVLDDEPFMVKLLVHMLERQGCVNVVAASDGAAALAMVRGAAPPDLILCDLNMPEMDGIEFIRMLGHAYAGSLILVSGEDRRLLLTAEKLAGAHHIRLLGHLTKPVLPDQLETLLGRWRPAPPRRAPAASAPYTAEELGLAIERGQLLNHYQPQVRVASGRVMGVEALVRWDHPRDGLVGPQYFITLAEEHGLIDALTRTVLTAALAQVRRWSDAGLDLRVSVNVSMLNLDSLDFFDFITGESQKFGVAPENIVLEVTETRLMQDPRAPLEVIARLRLRRFRLAIDDFGTGHASFAQLRDIPFDELKIDRGFVHAAWTDATTHAIHDASVGIARKLGLEVLAEGVEDEDDWRYIQRSGCDLAQGYFIARPMAAAAVLAWVGEHHAARRALPAAT